MGTFCDRCMRRQMQLPLKQQTSQQSWQPHIHLLVRLQRHEEGTRVLRVRGTGGTGRAHESGTTAGLGGQQCVFPPLLTALLRTL